MIYYAHRLQDAGRTTSVTTIPFAIATAMENNNHPTDATARTDNTGAQAACSSLKYEEFH